MLTLDSNFTAEFSKAEVEAVFLVEIYTGKDHADLLCLCTGGKGFTFSTIVEPYDGVSLGPVDVFPFVLSCTPISLAMDPYDRTIIKNSVTVTLANHPHVREFIKNNRLHARAVTIKMGTRNLTNELHWASVFAGVIESIKPRSDGIDVECKDFFRWSSRAQISVWTNKHPLEVIKGLLISQGVPDQYIDDDMFDPTHADYADDIGHYCITHSGHFTGGLHGPIITVIADNFPVIDSAQYDMILPGRVTHEYLKLIQDLVKLMVACLYFDETGSVRFVRFDTGNSAVTAWTHDDILSIEQVETIIVNQIEMEVTGERPDYGEPTTGMVSLKDTTSQTNHAYPDETGGLFVRSDTFLSINWHGNLQSEIDTTGGLSPVRVAYPFGFCGTRVTDGAYSNPWENMRHTTAALSGSKPLYVLVNDEVMKCISLDMVEHDILECAVFDMEDASMAWADKPHFADLTISSGNRGAKGTTATQHQDPFNPEDGTDPLEPVAKVFDVTMHIAYGETQLQRFSNGCEIIELKTSLSEWAVQVGDFVSVTHDDFLAYGFDGVDSGHLWEVIEKELALDDNQAHVRWKLAYATEASPPTINATYVWPTRGIRGKIDIMPALEYANETEVGVSRHTVMGLGATTSGLVVTVDRGAAGQGSGVCPFKNEMAYTVDANKDHYFSADLKIGGLAIQSVATGAAQPALSRNSVPIAKVVAGASTCTVTDLREFGAVRPRNMGTTDFEQGANLVPNPDFETWSRGPGYPPDHWEMYNPAVTTWGTDMWREETTTYSGRYALNINLSTLAGSYLQTLPFRVEKDRVYQFGISVKGSSTTAQCMVQIQWLDVAKAQVSAPILVNHNASADTTDMTRYDVFTTAPSTAVYARVLLSKWSDASPENGIFDAIRMVRAMPSFYVTNTTQTLPDGANTVIDFDVEAHDTGDSFDVTLGQNKFTAPFAGSYSFSAQILGNKLTNGHIDSYLYLAKNGSELIRGSKASLVRAKPSSFLVTNTDQTLVKGSPTVVDFDIEAHDSGGDFNSTLGQNKFTAPVAGTYIFSAQILATSLTNGHASSYIFLGKNGSEVIRGSRGYNAAAGYYDFKIESVMLELAASDYVQVVYFNAHASDSDITGSTTQNFFSGGLVQEAASDSYDYKVESGPIKLAASDYVQVVYHNAHALDSVLTGSTTQNYFSGRQIE